MEFCQPLLVQRTVSHKGVLPFSGRGFISCSAENVVISTFKLAEDGEGFIVRCYEACGRATEAVITLPPHAVTARESDLIERSLADFPLLDGRLSFSIAPYEIKTFRIQFAQ